MRRRGGREGLGARVVELVEDAQAVVGQIPYLLECFLESLKVALEVVNRRLDPLAKLTARRSKEEVARCRADDGAADCAKCYLTLCAHTPSLKAEPSGITSKTGAIATTSPPAGRRTEAQRCRGTVSARRRPIYPPPGCPRRPTRVRYSPCSAASIHNGPSDTRERCRPAAARAGTVLPRCPPLQSLRRRSGWP